MMGSNVYELCCERTATMRPSSPASRRSTKDAVSWRTGTCPRTLDGRPTISFGTGNVQLLEHEQRTLVQPNFDGLSCAFARLVSIGSATSFEVHGLRQEVAYFTSFYLYSVTRGIPSGLRAQAWPRITRYEDRWHWLVTSVVPRFRRFDTDTCLIDASMRRILDEARDYALTPCVLPHVSDTESLRRTPGSWVPRHPFELLRLASRVRAETHWRATRSRRYRGSRMRPR